MSEIIEIVEREIGTVLEIEERIPLLKMASVMGKDYGALQAYLEAQDCACTEAPYARYVDIDWEKQMSAGAIATFLQVFIKKWHVHVGMVTAEIVASEDNMVARTVPMKRYVKTLHRGPYQKVGETYKKLYAYLQQEGLTAEPESLEFYLNNPCEVKQEDLETEVLIPLT